MRHLSSDLPDWAAEYVGLPYLKHGRDRSGVDCWGLLCMIWEERLSGPLAPYEGVDWYRGQRPEVIGGDALAYASQYTEVPIGEERLGDGLLLRMRGHPFHVGLVLAPGWMIHTHESAGSVVERYRSMMWEKRVSAVYRPEPIR